MNIGDKVTWTQTTMSSRTISMQLKEGVVQSFDGDVAIVKLKSKRTTRVHISRLRDPSAKSEITEVLEAMRKEQ